MKNNHIIPLSKEEEELLYLIKKSNFVNKISITEFDLFKLNDDNLLNKEMNKRRKDNEKLVNQIELVYNKINKDKPHEESKRKRLMHEMLFNIPKDCDRHKRNKNDGNQISKKNLLPKLFSSEMSQQKKSNKLNNSRKDIFNNSKLYSNTESNTNILIPHSLSNNNSQDKNKKLYYIIQPNKNSSKSRLPPINKFRYKFHKLKLDVNNEIDHSDQQHEEMMRMYREIEFRNKNRFVI